MLAEQKQLKDFLIDSGLVSRADFSAAEKDVVAKNSTPAGELVSMGKLSEGDLRKSRAAILGIRFVNLNGEKLDFETLSLIPEPVSRIRNIVAFKRNGEVVEVAALEIEDLEAADFLKEKEGLKILPRLADPESIKNAVLQYQRHLKIRFGDLIKSEAEILERAFPEDARGVVGELPEKVLEKLADEKPAQKIAEILLGHSLSQNASDIHIESLEKRALVRYRMGGVLREAMVLPKNIGRVVGARIKKLAGILPRGSSGGKNFLHDGRLIFEKDGEKISFRVSAVPTLCGEKIVLRAVRQNARGFTLEALGFCGENLDRLHRAMKLGGGMILAVGPKGSGKTSTLYTILDLMNTPRVNISTIEKPVEYRLRGVNQIQIKSEIGLTFAGGLRAAQKQDSDIIMSSELEDSEAALVASRISLSGKLVVSSVVAGSAVGAILKLAKITGESFLSSSALDTVISMRLAHRLGEDKEKYFLSKAELNSLKKTADMEKVLRTLKEERVVVENAVWEKIPFFRPAKKSGNASGGENFSGKIGIQEVLKVSSAIREMVVGGKSEKEIEAEARKEGMTTLLEDGIFKAAQGLVSLEEVLKIVA